LSDVCTGHEGRLSLAIGDETRLSAAFGAEGKTYPGVT
jgi:hypothetical protein